MTNSQRQASYDLIRTEGNELPFAVGGMGFPRMGSEIPSLDGFVKGGLPDRGGRLRSVRDVPQALR
jgi:hypothetical protein